MDNYEPGVYTERVLEAVNCLRDQIMTNFAERVSIAVEILKNQNGGGGEQKSVVVDENEFIDASRLVYDGVREIRRTVLLNRTVEELDSETEIEYEDNNTYETRSKCKFF
ncbi:hypothetical protein BLA29_014675 [Euroglyphus maynei]|uniref:Uncharacterized protein n=1 Tax=Euroglyphus maynei TaxID=6958 RepID=A0A1Y3AR45_EURMA|nr:hypothetical protein BLA29_014675 [Euroglyphus maynei]